MIAGCVRNRLCGFRHGLKEILLTFRHCPSGTGAGGVDVTFPIGRSVADRHVFDRPAEAAHGMALKMREDNLKIVIIKVCSHDVLFQVLSRFEQEA